MVPAAHFDGQGGQSYTLSFSNLYMTLYEHHLITVLCRRYGKVVIACVKRKE